MPAKPSDTGFESASATSEPSAGTKSAGYATDAALPSQEYNWGLKQQALWEKFLDAVRFRLSDLAQDFVASYTAPSPAPGFINVSGAAVAYVGGRRVVLASTAKTYTASKDTYVDLAWDGTVTYIETANGAGAPALTANSVRLWTVITDGSDITGVSTEFVSYSAALRIAPDSRFDGDLEVAAILTAEDLIEAQGDIELTGNLKFVSLGLIDANGNTPDIGETADPMGTAYVQKVEVVNDYEYKTAKTRYLALPGTVGQGDSSWAQVFQTSGEEPHLAGSFFEKSGTSDANAEWPLELPDGATLTSIRVLADSTDNAGNGVFIYPVRRPTGAIGDGSLMRAAGAVKMLDADDVHTVTLDQNNVVDNSAYSYALNLWAHGASVVKVYGVRVTYTVTKTQ